MHTHIHTDARARAHTQMHKHTRKMPKAQDKDATMDSRVITPSPAPPSQYTHTTRD